MITVLLYIILGVQILGMLRELFGEKGSASGFIASLITIGSVVAALYFGGMTMFVIGVIWATGMLLGIIGSFINILTGNPAKGVVHFFYCSPMLVLMIIGLVQHWGTI